MSRWSSSSLPPPPPAAASSSSSGSSSSPGWPLGCGMFPTFLHVLRPARSRPWERFPARSRQKYFLTLFYTKQLLHKPAFTQTRFYTNSLFHTNELLHAPASTQTNFSTNQLLHNPSVGQRPRVTIVAACHPIKFYVEPSGTQWNPQVLWLTPDFHWFSLSRITIEMRVSQGIPHIETKPFWICLEITTKMIFFIRETMINHRI